MSLSIEDFPNEVIIQIFSYLNPADRIEASLVCIKWFEVFTLSKFVNDFYLNFNKCNLSKFESPGIVFQNALRNYSSLYLRDIHAVDENFDDIWLTFGQTFTEVAIKNCACITGAKFGAFLRHFPCLKTLRLYGQITFHGIILRNVTHLDLTECTLDKDDAEAMLDNMPALEKLRLNWDTVIDIENVSRVAVQHLTISFLEKISQKKEYLQLDLALPVPFYDEEILVALSRLCNIRLSQFVLKTVGDVPNDVFKVFFETQSAIEVLELHNSRALTRTTLNFITSNLQNLKSLTLPSGTPYFETPLDTIQGINSLEMLAVNVHFEVDEERRAVLMKNTSTLLSLKTLNLPNIHTKICNDSLKKIVESFPNLQQLDLSSSRLDDDGLHIIFKGLPYLRELILDKCGEITDIGLTGNKNPNFALDNIKGLFKLSLSTCKKITDLSLIASFKLPELRYLNLRNLENITELGIDALVTTCQSLEDLNLSYCTRLNERSLRLIDQNLLRLKCLDVSGCKGLHLNQQFNGRKRKIMIVSSGYYYPIGVDEFC